MEIVYIVLTNIEKKGFNIVTVSDLMYNDNYAIDSNVVQKKK